MMGPLAANLFDMGTTTLDRIMPRDAKGEEQTFPQVAGRAYDDVTTTIGQAYDDVTLPDQVNRSVENVDLGTRPPHELRDPTLADDPEPGPLLGPEHHVDLKSPRGADVMPPMVVGARDPGLGPIVDVDLDANPGFPTVPLAPNPLVGDPLATMPAPLLDHSAPAFPGHSEGPPMPTSLVPTSSPAVDASAPAFDAPHLQLGGAAVGGGIAGGFFAGATDLYRSIVLGEDVGLGEAAFDVAAGAGEGAVSEVGEEIVGHGVASTLARAVPILAGGAADFAGRVAGGGIVDGAIAGITSTFENSAALEAGTVDSSDATANVLVDAGIGFGSGLAGAAVGATVGSTVGSVVPVAGTALGGAVGAGVGFAAGALTSMGISALAHHSGFSDWAKEGLGDGLEAVETPLDVLWGGVNGAIDGAGTGAMGGAAAGALATGGTGAAIGMLGGPLGALAGGAIGAGVGALGGGLIGAIPGAGIGAGAGIANELGDIWFGADE